MSTNETIIKPKSEDFALRIVKLFRVLTNERKEYVLSKQLLRSGTSIGANITEAQYAQSRPDFISKMNIALKEAAESEYWIDLLYKAEIITEEEHKSLINDLLPIKKMLILIVKHSKE